MLAAAMAWAGTASTSSQINKDRIHKVIATLYRSLPAMTPCPDLPAPRRAPGRIYFMREACPGHVVRDPQNDKARSKAGLWAQRPDQCPKSEVALSATGTSTPTKRMFCAKSPLGPCTSS